MAGGGEGVELPQCVHEAATPLAPHSLAIVGGADRGAFAGEGGGKAEKGELVLSAAPLG